MSCGPTEPLTQTLSLARRGRVAQRPDEGARPAPSPTGLARVLRSRQTDPERLLWSRLRTRRLAGWKFRRQFPIGRFVVDFCCPDASRVVELDGGGHAHDGALAADAARTREIEAGGYFLMRFWNREVVDNLDGVCETILSAAEGRLGR